MTDPRLALEDELMSNALRVAFGGARPPVRIASAEDAVRVEFDEGRVICRACLRVMETDESEGYEEGRPLCAACLRDKADYEHGGEA